MTITIGPYTSGEVPAPLTYTFQDDNGDPLDLTGYIATFSHEANGVGTSETATVTDAANGVVTYTWTATDLDEPGSHSAEFWVSNGTNTYASDLIRWRVRAAIPVT